MLSSLYARVIAPRTENEDARRRATVLNSLLAVSLALALTAVLLHTVVALAGGDVAKRLARIALAVGFAGICGLLLAVSRRGGHRIASIGALLLWYLVDVALSIIWGVYLPTALLIGASVVVMSGVLLGGREGLIAVAVVAVTYIGLSAGESAGVWTPDYSWAGEAAVPYEAAVWAVLFFAMALSMWHLNRERLQSVDQVLSGGSASSPLRQLRTKTLSIREVEVVQLVAAGRSNDEIAAELFISPRTVQTHIANAMKKTTSGNRTELGVLAVREGLVPLEPNTDAS